jgi:hypothetical protein
MVQRRNELRLRADADQLIDNRGFLSFPIYSINRTSQFSMISGFESKLGQKHSDRINDLLSKSTRPSGGLSFEHFGAAPSALNLVIVADRPVVSTPQSPKHFVCLTRERRPQLNIGPRLRNRLICHRAARAVVVSNLRITERVALRNVMGTSLAPSVGTRNSASGWSLPTLWKGQQLFADFQDQPIKWTAYCAFNSSLLKLDAIRAIVPLRVLLESERLNCNVHLL